MKNKYVQASLDGIKASVIGIIITTGAWLIINNLGPVPYGEADIRAIIITVVLAALYMGLNRVLKKNKKKTISPIMLIGIAAVIGVVAYGIDWGKM